MACDAFTIPNFTQAQFDSAVAKAAESGVVITGMSGQVQHDGATVSYLYNPDRQELTLQVLHKPFLVSCDFVESKLKELLGVE